MLLIPDSELDRLLGEDAGYGDLTTRALGIGSIPGVMRFSARGPMVVSAIEEAARLLRRLDLDVCLYTSSGSCVEAGTPLLQAAGPAARLHLGWKTAQTLVEWASGIASSVHQIALAARAERRDVVVACTRKTVPLNRALTIKAVLAGGGTMHRSGLGDTILLFAEHRTFLPGMSDADLVDRLRANAPERKLTAEVSDVETALRMARAGIHVLQLEKFATEAVAQLASALAGRPRRPLLAAAGGVNAANAARYAAAGADILVTSAPYSAPPRDVQVVITKGA